MCSRPAAAVVPGGLRRGESLICSRCVAAATEGSEGSTVAIDGDDLADAYCGLGDAELTSEEEYAEALDNEVRWELEPDGTITPRAT